MAGREIFLALLGEKDIWVYFFFLNQNDYLNHMKNRKDLQARASNDEFSSNWKTNYPQSRDIKQSVLEKLEARKIKNHHSDANGGKVKKVHTLESQHSDHLKPNKNEQAKRITNQRYFKKERPEDRKVVGEKMQKSGSDGKDLPQQKKKFKDEAINEQYLQLNEKLNNIEKKISDMKKTLQKKKQYKIQQEKEEQERAKQEKERQNRQGEKKKRKPSLQNLVTQVPEHQQLHNFDKNPYSPRHNIYYVSEIVKAYKDKQSIAREHLQTSLQIMTYFQNAERPSDAEFSEKKLNLPKLKEYEGKKTVIFDLDETLIHCNENLNTPFDVKLPIVFPTGEVIQAGVNIRPYAKEIIQKLSKNFEVIVFTASHSCYANVVVDYLDPEKKYIQHRLFREHCYATPQGMHIKDLRILNRQMSDMVLVDNAAYSYLHQLENGIPIIPYYRGKEDFELKALEGYIDSMLLVKDMRSTNRRTFKLHQYSKYYTNLDRLVQELYLVEHNL